MPKRVLCSYGIDIDAVSGTSCLMYILMIETNICRMVSHIVFFEFTQLILNKAQHQDRCTS
jgi:hypothetical protein